MHVAEKLKKEFLQTTVTSICCSKIQEKKRKYYFTYENEKINVYLMHLITHSHSATNMSFHVCCNEKEKKNTSELK